MEKNNTIKRVHLYTPATVNKTEMWLKQQAKEGWQLIDVNGWNFLFCKCNPYDGEYLMYSTFGTEKGLSSDYHMAKTKYGKSNGKSELNKRNKGVFEADFTKLDKEYFRFVKMRNSNYLRHYICFVVFCVILLVIALGVVLFAVNSTQGNFLLFIVLPPLIYAVISLIILLKDIKRLK
ncbi:MAG: DUF2812 domain-containing protein [Oscillospiraceae bacterium]|nr:DUF2812 domain-containing protein [Oscillospiraceae bacterium]